MNAPHSSARTPLWRKRAAAVFAAVGALVFSSGIVMLSAPAANAADNIAICHAGGSETNPYQNNSVDPSSTDLSGHKVHVTSPQTWTKGTWWHGTWYPAGSAKPDLIPGYNFDGPLPEGYCDAVGTGPIEVTPDVTFVDPDCGVAASWTGAESDKVTYAVASGSSAPNSAITVSATPNAGYEFGKKAQTSFSYTFPAAPDCRGLVTPEAPTVSQPACTGPGTSSPLTVTPATTAGIDYQYDEVSRVLTATAANGSKFGDLPAGWMSSSDTVATFQVPLVPAGACLVPVNASEPSATAPTCLLAGSLVLPSQDGDGYHWTGDTADGVGAHTVTAAADTGYKLEGKDTWTVTVLAAGSGLDCSTPPTPVTPLEPEWVEATCAAGPAVNYRDVTGVAYATSGTVAPGNSVKVTATATGNHVLADNAVDSWSHQFLAAPSNCGGGPVVNDPGTPDPVIPAPEPAPGVTLVTPILPSATEADCSHRGFLVVPPQPAGVLMTRSGSVPGDVTFTFAPAAGYAFPDGTVTETTVTVEEKLSGEDCILGEETTKPKPHGTKSKPKPRDRAPIVLGTQAAVPTAVDAGLAGLPSASVSPISSPRLAQALVAGGLLLLIAGGSMGLGRRTRGAHES